MPRNAAPCRRLNRTQSALIDEAERYLRGAQASAKELYDQAERLKRASMFGYARKLYARADESPPDDDRLRRKIRQRHALCTYKDPDLPADDRLRRALEILNDIESLHTTRDHETLGLAGAICKRRWKIDAQKENLERSLSYYRRGYLEGIAGDQGYNAINAAFVLDQLASIEEREANEAGTDSQTSRARRAEADRIRGEIVEILPDLPRDPEHAWLEGEWFYYATMVEAHFGIGDYSDAENWARRGIDALDRKPPDPETGQQGVPEWELRTTATQLAALARYRSQPAATTREMAAEESADVLRALLGDDAAALDTAYIGKVGLALSGGGFRASLFHIGVLARLADLDVLRHIEVLSCVSGGSILGAHYYLELKRLLESKADNEIERSDYIEVVERVEKAFLAGVQKNIRVRVAAEFLTNLKMIFLPAYSRTQRAGELYERHLYARIEDGTGRNARWLTDLYIFPPDPANPGKRLEDFKPKRNNWKRLAKVPDLILNATTLNTGHNWQFTAAWMGEPPGSINTHVDGNYRLRRMYYWEAPRRHQCVRLGHAVAASACVPGLFEPIAFRGLYPDRTVRLVDGGVHDNQGIVGLLEQDCNLLLVSDASGQMGTVDEPSSGVLGVPLRSSSISQARVRSEQFDDLVARQRSGMLRGVMLIHLKKDLDVDPVDWVDCQDPIEGTDDARPASRRGVLTTYGLRRDVQRSLSAIRTDLDTFSDAEAWALMVSGYRMTEHAFRTSDALHTLPVSDAPPNDWRFLAVEPAMTEVNRSKWLVRLLDIGALQAFKVWRLYRTLKALAVVLALLALGVGVWLARLLWNRTLVDGRTLAIAIAAAIVTPIVGKGIMRIVQFRSTLQKIAIGVGLSLGGFLVARLHLWIFDPLFVRAGRLPEE